MNREIKFRAWDDGVMIYEANILHLSNEDSLVLRLAKFWCNIRNDSKIMQYTGFKDVNGKEIYEGDVLQVTYIDVVEPTGVGVINSVVSFENGMFVCKDEGFDYEGKKEQPMSLYEWMKGEQVTIIRNIYKS
jgi:uncharacterized phage protein (TIGR01671 family)